LSALRSSYCSSLPLPRRPPLSTLFPYTTLFRSAPDQVFHQRQLVAIEIQGVRLRGFERRHRGGTGLVTHPVHQCAFDRPQSPGRSEEHTSELQSRENLVCRLLLEKNKKNNTAHS